MTLDCFILRSSSFFTNSDHPQSRVISAHSWYLTSFFVPLFLRTRLGFFKLLPSVLFLFRIFFSSVTSDIGLNSFSGLFLPLNFCPLPSSSFGLWSSSIRIASVCFTVFISQEACLPRIPCLILLSGIWVTSSLVGTAFLVCEYIIPPFCPFFNPAIYTNLSFRFYAPRRKRASHIDALFESC